MWEKELEVALKAVVKAQAAIMEIYKLPFDVEIKEDNSPVTLADKTADSLIRQIIHEAFPGHAFLTEESEDNPLRRKNDFCWIVDPVDGTKDFVAKNDEFTTNVALSYKGHIVVGVVAIPAKNTVYYAVKGQGTYKRVGNKLPIKIHVNDKIKDLTVLTSRFHVHADELDVIEKHKDRIVHRKTFGSALKACFIAEGLAEISYRLTNGTKEWDIAASQIVVTEAGGLFIKPDGSEITYNREDVYNREGYIIINRIENLLL